MDLVHLVLLEDFVGDRADQPLIALSFLYYTCVCSVFNLSPGHAFTLMGIRKLGPQKTWIETSRLVSEYQSAHLLRQLGPYEKTTRTINNYCCLTDFFNKIDGNHKDTVICQKYWEM